MAGTSILWYLRGLAAAGESTDAADSDLLERFSLRQDQAAFELLLARHGPMVWGVCRDLLADAHAAEDAFQATFLVLVRKARSISRRHLLGNWLYGVAHRVAARARSQAIRRLSRACDGVSNLPSPKTASSADADLARVLHEELNRLPDRYRGPIVLCHLQGKTREEAARQLGLSLDSLRGRLERGRERLRLRLTKRGITAPAAAIASLLSEKCATATVPAVLLAATAKAGWMVAAGASAASISPSIVVLMEGALQAMFIQKVKLTAVAVAGLGILTAGTNTILQSPLAADQPPLQSTVEQKSGGSNERATQSREVNKPAPAEQTVFGLSQADRETLLAAFKGSEKVKSLLKGQLEAAYEQMEARFREFLAGRGTLDILLEASICVLQAELDVCPAPKDRLKSFEAHSKCMYEIMKINKLRFESGRIPISDYAQSKFFHARSELWIERLKAGQELAPLGWWDAVDPRMRPQSRQNRP